MKRCIIDPYDLLGNYLIELLKLNKREGGLDRLLFYQLRKIKYLVTHFASLQQKIVCAGRMS